MRNDSVISFKIIIGSVNMFKTKKRLLLVLIFALICVTFAGCGVQQGAESDDTDIPESGAIFEITEILDEKQYDEYMTDDGTLYKKLIDFKKLTDNSPEFEFYAFSNNFIEVINAEIPAVCTVNHGTEFEGEARYGIDGESITATEAIQVSENFFDLYPVELTAGRSFEAADFTDETVPVILGSAYKDFFMLGDTFEAYYICERKAFKVIGFTDDESKFYSRSGNALVPYGNCIIMPFANVTDDSYSARAILLQEICGFIAPKTDRSSALKAIREYLKDSGLDKWSDAVIISEKSLQEKMNRE